MWSWNRTAIPIRDGFPVNSAYCMACGKILGSTFTSLVKNLGISTGYTSSSTQARPLISQSRSFRGCAGRAGNQLVQSSLCLALGRKVKEPRKGSAILLYEVPMSLSREVSRGGGSELICAVDRITLILLAVEKPSV